MALTDVYGDIWGDCWNGDIWGRAPVEAPDVSYYSQFYYMLLTGNNPYDALELPFGLVGTAVVGTSLVG